MSRSLFCMVLHTWKGFTLAYFFFAYDFAYLFWNYSHDILPISLHHGILHIKKGYVNLTSMQISIYILCIFFTYFAYFLHILHIILLILHIKRGMCNTVCTIFCNTGIVYILQILIIRILHFNLNCHISIILHISMHILHISLHILYFSIHILCIFCIFCIYFFAYSAFIYIYIANCFSSFLPGFCNFSSGLMIMNLNVKVYDLQSVSIDFEVSFNFDIKCANIEDV